MHLIKKKIINEHVVYTILGIKFKFKRVVPFQEEDLRAYILAARFNPSLEKYRGIYTGESIVIVGGGPTVKYYEPIDNAIHIGINRSYMLNNIKFNYLFAQDDFPEKDHLEGFINYYPDNCTKFLGLHTVTRSFRIRNSTIARIKNKEIYVLNNKRPDKTFIPIDITGEPFAFYRGTVFAVLQFAFLTNAKNVYLVGFDCTSSGHAFKNWHEDLTYQLSYWKQFKQYKDMFFETTEIISVNPVNLKGMFKDVYTQKFVNENKININDNIEILNIKGE